MRIKQWSQSTNLVFHYKKTKSMLFSTRKMSKDLELYNDDILTIICNNQKTESVEQDELLSTVTGKHFELPTRQKNFERYV